MEIIQIDPAALVPYENNTKTHPPEQIDRIAESIKRFGWWQPIVIDRDNVVIVGHGRLAAAKQLMLDKVPVVYADTLTPEMVQAYRLADNKTNESPWDFGKLEEELAALAIEGVDMTAFGFDDLEKELASPKDDHIVPLTDRFIIPPFSVLDARQGYWQERKKAWKEKIGDKGQARDVAIYSGMENWSGGAFADASILDPVLSELACRWFMPGGATRLMCLQVIPFSGTFPHTLATISRALSCARNRQSSTKRLAPGWMRNTFAMTGATCLTISAQKRKTCSSHARHTLTLRSIPTCQTMQATKAVTQSSTKSLTQPLQTQSSA